MTCISIDEYNSLRDFKIEMEKGNTFIISGNGYHYNFSKTFVSTDEAVALIAKENGLLIKTIEELRTPEVTTIDDVKKMSYWEFHRWKKTLR